MSPSRPRPSRPDDAGDAPLPAGTRPPRHRVTLEEYLAFERRHPLRHEYVDGYVYAMAGAKLRHNRIIRNLVRALDDPAEAAGCQLYLEGVKLRVDDDVFYPDALVVCAPHDEEDDMVDDACLLVEVLSPSTARRDRSEKLEKYRSLPRLLTYLIVAQRERHVIRHWRDGVDRPWRRDELAGDGEIPLRCPAGSITLEQLYRGLSVAAPRLRRVRERAAR